MIRQRKFSSFFLVVLGLLLVAILGAIHLAPTTDRTLVELAVFADSLADGWQDWSWGNRMIDFSSSNPVFSGDAAVSVTFNVGWAGFMLGRKTNLDISGYDEIQSAIHGCASGGQPILEVIEVLS